MQTRKVDEETREIGFAQRQSDGRHDNAFHQRRNDLSECGADYYCNCQVDHISASDELFEFSPHGCVLLLSNCRLPIANLFCQLAIGNWQSHQWQFLAILNPAFSASAAVLNVTLFASVITCAGWQPFG